MMIRDDDTRRTKDSLPSVDAVRHGGGGYRGHDTLLCFFNYLLLFRVCF